MTIRPSIDVLYPVPRKQVELARAVRPDRMEVVDRNKRSGGGESWEALAHRAQFKPARLALICDVSLRTVQRHFSKQYGMKVGEWLRSVRLHNAYWRLRKGDSVKEIAIDLGYTQVSNFSRDFKRFHGFCPSLIRGHRLPLERPETTSTLVQV